ncbi:tRNA (mnm(5)s(2)U34)-methyltransferase [Caldalkalibacillus salinus]|uniref:tRNA (mnm(5)s(2)U34)-methyltransferase n=1 Tax=Caldalkalibacillus salinus TaxID=2803787 RepID=UPI00192439AA|nr:class I SAM-dependent methyltransferase [Caldalkalibacillus salinus]
MPIDRVLPYTHHIIQDVVNEGDLVVDATMGNGHDTLFLAQLVGKTGKVLSYDVQPQALAKTKERLIQAQQVDQVQLCLKGHETIHEELSKLNRPLSAAMFNLGYLPGSDKTVVTQPETTIQALYHLREYLKPGGIIAMVVYHGHEQGKAEKNLLLEEVMSWEQKSYDVLQYQFINQKNDPPFLLAIQKK